MRPTDLAIVVPTRGRPDVLGRTIAALREQTVDGFELIVVVDGEDQARPDLPDARVLVQPHRGPGAARNRGAETTSRPLLLFLGDDMVPERNLVERHLDGHSRHPAAEEAVLGRVEWHPDVRRNRLVKWIDRAGMQFDVAGLNGPDVEAGWARFTTANASLKRSLFEAAGGFDEDFFFLYEDIELGWRLGQRGMILYYEPGAACRHLHGYDLESFRNRMIATAKSERLMTIKHPWFEPWFRPRFIDAMGRPRPLRLWPLLVEWVPPWVSWLRERAEQEATIWYLQQAAPAFFENWEGEDDFDELREYLGDSFDAEKLVNHRQAIEAEQRTAPSESTFYRTSEAYLYELSMFGRWQIKTPYLIDILRLAPPPSRVLDYGCGIGTDGLRMQRLGYDVSFADLDNPSTRYLRWRLRRRGIDAPVYDVERDVRGGHDLVFAFDVIEHLDDPWAFLEALESLARIVVVNLLELEPERHHNDLHRPLPISSILDHAARRGLLRYRLYHGRSHLVAYRGEAEGSSPSRLASRTELRLGRLLSRLEGLAG